MRSWLRKAYGLAVVPVLLAIACLYLTAGDDTHTRLSQLIAGIQQSVQGHFSLVPVPMPDSCSQHNYTTQIVSIDPLVIYIHNFLPDAEMHALLESAESKFKPSLITKYGRTAQNPDRTSHTAFLSSDDGQAAQCVLERARQFSGTLLKGVGDDLGRPQLVRYTKGQQFKLHYDWYPRPQKWDFVNGETRTWNRIASFFVTLEDDCEEGETWFPNIDAAAIDAGDNGLWRKHPDGGLAFRPVRGNSLFWVNLHANGTGDERLRHAGLPLKSGRKTAMNIWPRRYFDREEGSL